MKKRAGSELRDAVAELLSIKHSTVQLECRLSATTADIFYVDDTSTFPQKIAVECKDWSKPLTSSDIASICNLYRPSIDSGEIEKVLIVSRHELGMQPADTVGKIPYLRHLRFEEFVHRQMNFGLLLESNIAAFENHEASKNFIHPRISGSDVRLSDSVYKWLDRDSSPVAMVYGGYGLGKTSFSYFLASELTRRYRSGSFNRIPIRISLGGLYTKQDLKALICAELSGAEGQPAVGQFGYELFIRMLKSGAVFLILDGFDEMRHAMSIEDFAYTFEQMSPLFSGKSKALILGRPDAFFDESEEVDVIGSLVSSTQLKFTDIPIFEVDRFTREEVDGYMSNFRSSRSLTDEEVRLIDQLTESEYQVLSRPVQANMFTKVIASLSRKSEFGLTRYRLYSEFVKLFAMREESKASRSLADRSESFEFGFSDPRSVFMQELAWWLSTAHRENRFLPSDIPFDCLPLALRYGKDKVTAIREALIGSIVEHDKVGKASGLLGQKGKNYYYFPHKSYVEFLVSQYFCRVDFSKDTYRVFFSFANPEMISFVREGPEIGANNISTGLGFVLGNVHRELIEIGAESERVTSIVTKGDYSKIGQADRYMVYERLFRSGSEVDLRNFLLWSVNNARVAKTVSTSLRLLGEYLAESKSSTFMHSVLANSVAGLQDVQFRAPIKASDATFDNSFVHSVVLGQCVLRDKKGNLWFHTSKLIAAAHKSATGGMWCSDVTDGSQGGRGGVRLAVSQRDLIAAIKSAGYSSIQGRVSRYFTIHEFPAEDKGVSTS